MWKCLENCKTWGEIRYTLAFIHMVSSLLVLGSICEIIGRGGNH